MKTGTNYSEFLDEFTKNYNAMAKIHENIAAKFAELNSLLKEANEADALLINTSQNEEKTAETQKTYSDFLDKCAKNKVTSEDRIKEARFKFVNTEPNRDNHICELILRKTSDKYKIKLTHYSGSFDYAAFQSIWHFSNREEKTANKVFDTLEFALNGIKDEHNKNQKHSSSLTPMIREAIKPIEENHQYNKNSVTLNESDLQQGESNWQQTLYGNKYPQYEENSKQELFNGKHSEGKTKRTFYTGRSSNITKEI